MSAVEENDTGSLVARVRSRGAYPHVLDAGADPDKMSTMDEIAVALSFPDWFGRNLDALYDLLTDLSWLPEGEHVLIWVAADVLKRADPKGYLGIHAVLSDAQRAMAPNGDRPVSRRLRVLLSDG